MNTRDLARLISMTLALLLALSSWVSHADDVSQHKIADGLSVYIGVLPAEILLGHPKGHIEREMHGGAPAGTNRYHVVVALFDVANGKRVSDAQVKIGGAGIGMTPSHRKAEPMLINNTATYGAYVTLPGPGPFRIWVTIKRAGRSKPAEVVFDYPFARS